MKRLSQNQIKRLTAVHGWSGMLLGTLLYTVIVTGTVAVLAHEIAEWSVGGKQAADPLATSVDRNVRLVVEPLPKGYRQSIGIWGTARGDLMVFPHAHAQNPETGEMSDYGPMFRMAPSSGEVLFRDEGFAFSKPEWYEASALEDFLIDLHVQLYMPTPWGLILTGILGLTMMAAGVSGVVIHRHLIRDLFVGHREGKRLVSARDRHVLAASWGLVFTFLLGFTGSFFSLAPTVTFPLLANVAFGGDQEAMADVLFEPQAASDPRPVPMADLDRIIAESGTRTGSAAGYIEVSNYGRADSRISIWHEPPPGRLAWVHNVFDGATGEFLGVRPVVGQTPSTGALLYDLMWPMHTGDFAGIASKSVWVGLGSAMAFVVISGMRLWAKRREDQILWRRFNRAVTIVGYGLPAAMLSSAYAYFLALGAGANEFWWTPAGFLIGVALGMLPGLVARDEDSLKRFYRLLLGVGLILLPIVRMATGGLGWTAAAQGQGTVLSVDLALILLGAALMWWARRSRTLQAPEPAPAE